MNPILFHERSKKERPQHLAPPSSYVGVVHPLSAAAAAYIDKHVFYCSITKGKTILKAGQVCPYIFLVYEGVLRGFFKDGNRDITTWITAENEFVTSISSFFTQRAALESIQALEDCFLAVLHFDDIQYLYEHHPEMNVVSRKILEQYYYDAEQRAYLGRLNRASDKYAYFIQTKNYLVNRVPLKYIASYLGIALETLSRLRGSLSKGRQEASDGDLKI